MSRYEKQDASSRAVRWFAVGLAVVVIAVAGTVRTGLLIADRVHPRGRQPDSYSRQEPFRQRSAVPLQVRPEEDLRKYEAEQDGRAQTYRWRHREEGKVWLPIERAMELLVQEGGPW